MIVHELLNVITANRVAVAKTAASDEYQTVLRLIVKAKYPGKRLDQLSDHELHMVSYYATQTGFYMQKYNATSSQALAEVLKKAPSAKQIGRMLE
jgi:hypothetical protein